MVVKEQWLAVKGGSLSGIQCACRGWPLRTRAFEKRVPQGRLKCQQRKVEFSKTERQQNMKRFGIIGLFVAGLVLATQAQTTFQIGTGLDASGNDRPLNNAEQNYTLSGGAGPDTLAIVRQNGAWTADQNNYWAPGQWITPLLPNISEDQSTSLFYYTRTIDGTGSISGYFASDNGAELFVNGIPIQADSNPPLYGFAGSFTYWTAFSATLNQPVNTVVFEVNNGGGPTGLIVQGTATIGVPDGGCTAALLSGVFFGLQALRRKLRLS